MHKSIKQQDQLEPKASLFSFRSRDLTLNGQSGLAISEPTILLIALKQQPPRSNRPARRRHSVNRPRQRRAIDGQEGKKERRGLLLHSTVMKGLAGIVGFAHPTNQLGPSVSEWKRRQPKCRRRRKRKSNITRSLLLTAEERERENKRALLR